MVSDQIGLCGTIGLPWRSTAGLFVTFVDYRRVALIAVPYFTVYGDKLTHAETLHA